MKTNEVSNAECRVVNPECMALRPVATPRFRGPWRAGLRARLRDQGNIPPSASDLQPSELGARHLAFAFTLTELLVVIAIIAILAALLLPALKGIWWRARVMACPIAYTAADAYTYICDPYGKTHYRICPFPPGGMPRWSPTGYKLYLLLGDQTVIVDVMTKSIKIFPPAIEAATWIDDHTVQGTRYFGSYNDLWRMDTRTGEATVWKKLKDLGLPYGAIVEQCEPVLTDGFVVSECEAIWSPMGDIVIRDMDWNLKKVIWSDASNDVDDSLPHLDPFGEWIAWDRSRAPGPGNPKVVALKQMSDDPDSPPRIIGTEYNSVIFNSWTPQGELLVQLLDNGVWQLAIFKTDGTLIRRLSTPHGVASWDGAATWRFSGELLGTAR